MNSKVTVEGAEAAEVKKNHELSSWSPVSHKVFLSLGHPTLRLCEQGEQLHYVNLIPEALWQYDPKSSSYDTRPT